MPGRKHEWRTRNAEGDVVIYRGVYFGAKWELQSRLKSEEDWTYHDPPSKEQWSALRDIVEPKYRRKRLPYEALALIDAELEELDKIGAASEVTEEKSSDEPAEEEPS